MPTDTFIRTYFVTQCGYWNQTTLGTFISSVRHISSTSEQQDGKEEHTLMRSKWRTHTCVRINAVVGFNNYESIFTRFCRTVFHHARRQINGKPRRIKSLRFSLQYNNENSITLTNATVRFRTITATATTITNNILVRLLLMLNPSDFFRKKLQSILQKMLHHYSHFYNAAHNSQTDLLFVQRHI